ncbi:MAG: GMC family oxidoreductase N-terminal domain-containing protein [Acetobacteraceae bacterium]
MTPTHIIVGGRLRRLRAGGRLSENAANRVLLIEAGPDLQPDQVPGDILDGYAGWALNNPGYFWNDLQASRSDDPSLPERSRQPGRYEQRGSSGAAPRSTARSPCAASHPTTTAGTNSAPPGGIGAPSCRSSAGSRPTRTSPTRCMAARGPIAIRRFPPDSWDPFTRAVAGVWAEQGHAFRPDMNGAGGAGYSPIPLANTGQRRAGPAIDYLTTQVRQRPNLAIRTDTEVRHVVIEDGRATGIAVGPPGAEEVIPAETVVLSAGALHTPGC